MNAKQLHKHAVPVVLLGAGLFLTLAVGAGQFMLADSGTKPGTTALLSERLFTMGPSAQGLFHISRYQPALEAQQNGRAISDLTHFGLSGMSSLGQSTTLDVTLRAP